MNLKKNELLDLPVYTQSGQHLGKVADFEVDPVSHTIATYFVKGKDSITGLLNVTELIIDRSQVISLSAEKMVVEDSVIAVRAADVVAKKPALAS